MPSPLPPPATLLPISFPSAPATVPEPVPAPVATSVDVAPTLIPPVDQASYKVGQTLVRLDIDEKL